MDDITLREFYLLYTRTAILRAELSKALEMVDSAMRLPSVRKDLFYRSECSFLKGTCLMYQGKLQQAEMYAQYAREEAQMIIGQRWLQGPTVPRHLFYISVKGWHWQKRLEMSSWYMMHIRKTLCLHQRMV